MTKRTTPEKPPTKSEATVEQRELLRRDLPGISGNYRKQRARKICPARAKIDRNKMWAKMWAYSSIRDGIIL
jgi:hypothetical protein